MRVVWAEPDPEWLERRKRWGIDRMDEVWDGVLHVPPRPSSFHQGFESALEFALVPVVKSLGLQMFHELSVYNPEKGDKDYRTPDLVIVADENISERGVEGRAELVVEILSPNDESREKFPFYAARGILEYWIVDPITREIEVYVLRGATYFAVTPNRDGIINAPRLGLELRVVAGPKLRIAWSSGSAEI